MNIGTEKSKIFGQLAALRVSLEGFPKNTSTNSIQSISNEQNSLDFLVDFSKALIGVDSIKETLINVLTHNLDDIELDIKQALKRTLKSLVSCSINPSLPQEFKNNGITLELSNIDLLDMFKVNPNSESGKLLYNDISNGTNSSDFNTFLYNIIQDNGGTSFWGNQTTNNDILGISFNQNSTNPTISNNTINVKPSLAYSSRKLTDINNDYIDSVKLFESNKLINNIIESIYGTISLNIKKNKSTIEAEIKIQKIIDRIINSDENITIDDSYFKFSNEELSNIESESELRRKGIAMVKTFDNVKSSIPIDSINKINMQLDFLNAQPNSPQLIEEKTIIVRKALNSLAEDSANNVNNEDKYNIKLNFIEKMLKGLMNSIVGVILSPKLIVILALNHSIIYGTDFISVEDFMKKNKSLINNVLQTVRDSVVSILLNRVLKEVKTLAYENLIKMQIEKINNKKAQMISLVKF